MTKAQRAPEKTLLARAEAGDAEAQNELGRQYASESSEKRSREMAERWFRRAADQGSVLAKHNLGVLCLGDPARRSEAVRWFEEASKEGSLPSVYAVGLLMLRAGMKDEAAATFESAAAQGHAGAQAMIGMAYHQGLGVDADPVEAAHWLLRSAEAGNEEAAAYLPRVLEEIDEGQAAEAMLRAGRALPRSG